MARKLVVVFWVFASAEQKQVRLSMW